MTEQEAARAVELLVEQADAARAEDRYPVAIAAAGRAVDAAEHLQSPNLLIRALEQEADALRMSGDYAAALARYTCILALAEDPTRTAGLDTPTTEAIAHAYTNWVVAARYAGGIPIRRLFGVLDAADHWLRATGHPDWRAPVLLERASLHRDLGEWEPAVAAARAALAAYHPDAPGHTLATHRFQLGDILSEAGRAGEAEPHYQAILDDPTTTTTANAHDRKGAWQGLAWCALARDDPTTALRHAHTAVQAAEPLGDEPLLPCLGLLVAAQRAAGDLDAAWHTATRRREVAARVGTHYRLYCAVRDAVDVGLDRGDHDTAAGLLDELDRHATALDHDTATTTRRDETQDLRARLTNPDATR